VLRRLQRRMGLASLFTLADYAARLRDSEEKVRGLANDMMINVTGSFAICSRVRPARTG